MTGDDHLHRLPRLRRLKREAVKINLWRTRAVRRLLVDVGPRIFRLGEGFYSGSGLHYSLVQSFGNLVNQLAIGFHPTMNWLEKNEHDEVDWIGRQAAMEVLVRRVREAEASALYHGLHRIASDALKRSHSRGQK